jgi:hypothetical protein
MVGRCGVTWKRRLKYFTKPTLKNAVVGLVTFVWVASWAVTLYPGSSYSIPDSVNGAFILVLGVLLATDNKAEGKDK